MVSRGADYYKSISATVVDPDTVRIGGSAFKRVYECQNLGGKEGANGEYHAFHCSKCGVMSDIQEPNYCPNCGAKVKYTNG